MRCDWYNDDNDILFLIFLSMCEKSCAPPPSPLSFLLHLFIPPIFFLQQARKALAERQKDLEVKTQQLEIKLSNKTEEDIKKARRKSTQAGKKQPCHRPIPERRDILHLSLGGFFFLFCFWILFFFCLVFSFTFVIMKTCPHFFWMEIREIRDCSLFLYGMFPGNGNVQSICQRNIAGAFMGGVY